MTTSVRIKLLVLSVTVLGVSAAQACGDKIAAMGSGVPFERVMAHHAYGRVVVFMNPGATSNAGDEAQNRLVRALERAGHHVSVVHSAAELEDTLHSGPVDVVLADIDASAPPALTALSARCVISPANRKAGSVVRTVDDIVARRSPAGDSSCAASGHPGI
jgi:hypothetical protein